MPHAIHDPALFKRAMRAVRSMPNAPCSPVLVATLPGWAKPLTFRITLDSWYVYLESANGLRLAVCSC